MTPTQMEQKAREKYNAVGSGFYSQSEILMLMYEASLEMAQECLVIERTYTTSTVASQQEYSMPTNAIAIKRVQYDGKRLQKINEREDDLLTMNNQTTTATGTPQYYWFWNEVLYLRPIPSAVATVKIWAYTEPQEITISSTLEVPSMFHMGIVNYIVSELCAKDDNWDAAARYDMKWEKAKRQAKSWVAKRKRTDGFANVQDEDSMAMTLIGSV